MGSAAMETDVGVLHKNFQFYLQQMRTICIAEEFLLYTLELLKYSLFILNKFNLSRTHGNADVRILLFQNLMI